MVWRSKLDSFLQGSSRPRGDVTLPPVMAERLEAIQPGVVPEFEALGLAFTAGIVDDRSGKAP